MVFTSLPLSSALACGGSDIVLSADPAANAHRISRNQKGTSYFDDEGNLLVNDSLANITPVGAQAIVEHYLKNNFMEPPLPVTFRKLEYVHGKLIYQFESQPIDGFNGQYHLGPVNFIVDRMVLDVDSTTGNIHLANGCGAAPGKVLYKFNPDDLDSDGTATNVTLVSNNTNFIARKTGNKIILDGKITEDEWKDTGHRYFYLGLYKEHMPSMKHVKASYYVEVRTQIDDENIYFAVRTDTPYWVGLVFKGDANLGMLNFYTDAKVLKSDGEVTDRHFFQRPDKSFFLKKDADDNIISSAVAQDEFYEYEFSFPLGSLDKKDVSFEVGNAYNMLLLVGNTREHYGIFTLDDSHKNHDHSKGNKEHADVWASTETTLRIGRAADRDIFGNPVTPQFASYVSGFDPAKSETHFHYAATSVIDYAGRTKTARGLGIFTLFMGIAGAVVISGRLRKNGTNGSDAKDGPSVDLMKVGLFRRFFMWRHFRTVFIIPTLIIFTAVVVLGFMDVQDGMRNIATIYTWTLWWSLIIVSFIVLGRFWCMMCPFALLGDLAQKAVSLNRRLPGWLRNMGFQTLAFILLTLAFALMAFASRPMVTSAVIIIITFSAMAVSMVYERRSFCRHLCPIGAVTGLYSTLSPIELRSDDKSVCAAHKTKDCANACPMMEKPQEDGNNIYCNFCMKCVPACPHTNLSLKLRAFGSDIFRGVKRTKSEAAASLFLLGIIVVETFAMTSVWEPLKASLGAFTGIESPGLVYSILFTTVFLVPVAVFYLLSSALNLWMGGGKGGTVRLVTQFAFVFIPLGVGIHLAHNVQHLFASGPVAIPATMRLFQEMGLFAGFNMNWNVAPLLQLGPTFFVQMGIIVTAFAFTLVILYRVLRRHGGSLAHGYKITVAMSLYAIVVIMSSIYILGLPMNGRHLH